jgi:hypothetical protein
MTGMDSSEQLAAIFLEQLELGPVIHEPDGNVPPDFLVAGEIAVEVRRLNQSYETNDSFEGLESAQAAITRFLRTTLPRYGSPDGESGWWVMLYFWRPLDWKAMRRSIKDALTQFKEQTSKGRIKYEFENFELELLPAGIPTEHYFMFGGLADRDAGGFVLAEIIRNLNLYIGEKARKVAPYRNRYREWWLVLPDHIGPDLNEAERSQISAHVRLQDWDRVIILHPRDHSRAVEIWSAPT